jgi:hypothetical protein
VASAACTRVLSPGTVAAGDPVGVLRAAEASENVLTQAMSGPLMPLLARISLQTLPMSDGGPGGRGRSEEPRARRQDDQHIVAELGDPLGVPRAVRTSQEILEHRYPERWEQEG